MKIQKQAFTLIELIVVTSILILISVTSVFYFSGFVDSFKLKSELALVENTIKSFDIDVRNKKTYDYEMHFKTGEGYFTTYQNIFDIPNYATGSFSSGTISILPTLTGSIWQVKVYNDYKMLLENFVGSDETFTYSFKDYTYYNIISYLGSSRINDIVLNFYSPDNLSFDPDLSLILTYINTSDNKETGTSINDLVVKNIGGRKEFYNGATKVNSKSIYLFFEKQGVEGIVEIIK